MTNKSKQLTGYPSIDKPWLQYYSEEAVNAELPNCSIYDYMYENNKAYPNDIAINYLGRKIKYKELFGKIDDTARAFQALDVKPGEIVTVALPSVPEALYVVYALNKIGAVANMIHPLAGREEIIHYLNEVESRVAIIFDGTYDILKESIKNTSVEHAIIVTAGYSLPFGIKQLYNLKNRKTFVDYGIYSSWKDFIKGGTNIELVSVDKDPSTMAIISHTGGTTGEPKGVMCSDDNINSLTWQLSVLPHKRGDRNLVVLPPFINYSLVDGMLGMVTLGIQAILIPDYRPNKLVDYIRKYKPSHISSIPPYWEALLEIDNIGNNDFASLQNIYYGGEAMAVENERRVNEILLQHGAKSVLHKGLGSTEMVSAATMTYDDCNTPGCAGVPLVKVSCKIVKPETIEELQYNQHGEICFSGPNLMIGYYNNPEATDEIVKIHHDEERWIHTGDIGYITEDGIIFISGRIKRILVTKGIDNVATKMFPDRIEGVINKHPSVKLSCVVGVPDKDRINYPKAIIELNDGHTPSKDLKREILQFCNGKLPDYQIPVEIEFIDVLPRTNRGKVDYRELERMTR